MTDDIKTEFGNLGDWIDDYKNQIAIKFKGLSADAQKKLENFLDANQDVVRKLKEIKASAGDNLTELKEKAKNDPKLQELIALLKDAKNNAGDWWSENWSKVKVTVQTNFENLGTWIDDYQNKITTVFGDLNEATQKQIKDLLDQNPLLVEKLKDIKNRSGDKVQALKKEADQNPKMQALIQLMSEDGTSKPDYNSATKMGLSAGILAFALLV